MKEFVSLTMFAMETEEKQFLVIIATAAMTKCFIRNMNLRDTNCYWKKWVDRREKILQPQKCTFREKRTES